MKRFQKGLFVSISAAMILSLAGCESKDPKAEQKAFDAFMEQVFVDAMEADYTTAHTFMEHPEDYGVDMSKVAVNLGTRIGSKAEQKATKAFEKEYEQFEEFDRDLLTKKQQDLYDIYEYQASLTEELNDDDYDYYGQAFQSMSGLQFQLPTLFADWELRNEQDVKDLITLVNDTRGYVDSALNYTKKQEKKGLLMTDLDAVIKYCDGILEQGENSSILTSMNASVAALGLEETKTSMYQSQLKDAFTSSFIPAYQDIRDTMQELKDNGKNNRKGLATFENGKAYYELLLQQNIGSDKSAIAIKTMMESEYNKHLENLQQIVFQHYDEIQPLINQEMPNTNYNSYDEILKDIQSQMFEDFPSINNLEYQIMDVNEEIASESGITAYFNLPALDSTSKKQLRVNPLTNNIKSIDTFVTVAHEGFPGHMYQFAYLYENSDSNYQKVLSNVSAYIEGYAVYAQYESHRYLDVNEALLAAYKENELASYCAIIAADIGIHYEGWDVKEFQKYLKEKGFALDDESAKAQYEQLWANPAAFEPYYVGYHEIIKLKDNAKKELGKAFDEKAFNQALLESGPAPFDVVERHIKAYIED